MLSGIDYELESVLVLEVLTHEEYSRDFVGLKQAAVSLILPGKRSLTTDAGKRLVSHFRVEAGYFF